MITSLNQVHRPELQGFLPDPKARWVMRNLIAFTRRWHDALGRKVEIPYDKAEFMQRVERECAKNPRCRNEFYADFFDTDLVSLLHALSLLHQAGLRQAIFNFSGLYGGYLWGPRLIPTRTNPPELSRVLISSLRSVLRANPGVPGDEAKIMVADYRAALDWWVHLLDEFDFNPKRPKAFLVAATLAGKLE